MAVDEQKVLLKKGSQNTSRFLVLALTVSSALAALYMTAPPAVHVDEHSKWSGVSLDVEGKQVCESKFSTACAAGSTCCASTFSSTGQGCCPHANGVCCEGVELGMCCPSGHSCEVSKIASIRASWGVNVVCKPAAGNGTTIQAAEKDVNQMISMH